MAQHAHKRKRVSSSSNGDGGATVLLTPAVLRDAQAAWATAATDDDDKASRWQLPAEVVPAFKVGTHEMYKRHARAYEALMQRHDCSALQRVLVDDVLAHIVRTHDEGGSNDDDNSHDDDDRGAAFVRVLDVGCGTGRVAGMVVQHAAVRAVYAYDSAAAMLQRCVVHTVRCARAAGHYSGVVLSSCERAAATRVVHTVTDKTADDANDGHATQTTHSQPRRPLLQLCACVRSYDDLRHSSDSSDDALSPRVQLIVCAWSLSYVMREQWGADRWHDAIDATVAALLARLDDTHSDAALVVVETLGTDTVVPTRCNTLARRLEEQHGFVRTCIRTDYVFASVDEAVRLTRFFYGATRADALRARDATRLHECTGIWTRWQRRRSSSVATTA